MLLQHGRKDPVVPVQQSIEFAQKLKQKFGEQKIILEIIENAEHADPAFETKDNIERVLKFIKDSRNLIEKLVCLNISKSILSKKTFGQFKAWPMI